MNIYLEKVKTLLQEATNALNGSEINMNNFNDDDVDKLNTASTTAWWAIRDSLSVIEYCEKKGASMPSMKWLTDFLDDEEAQCERSREHENDYENDIADSMFTSGQLKLIESLRKLIAQHQAPYMSKQDMADELAIMRDEERRGK